MGSSSIGPVHIRRCVIDTLVKRSPGVLFSMLEQIISIKDANVQLTAVHGFWRLGDRRAIVLIQQIAANRRHPHWKAARRAIESFGTTEPQEVTLVRPSMENAKSALLVRPIAEVVDPEPELLLRPGNRDA
jgi:hypothetical protein